MKDFIVEEFKKKFNKKKVFIISAATGEGVEVLKDYLIDNFSTSVVDHEQIKFINEQELKIIDIQFNEDPKHVELEYL
jgi:selenocysteine-specific translation elongation factor